MTENFRLQCRPNHHKDLGYHMKLTRYFALAAIPLVLLNGCASSKDPAEAFKGENSVQIFQRGEDALRKRNYSEATKRFEALEVQYPLEPRTQIAELHIIYAYYMSSDYASAEAAADRFIHSHPTNPHIDYAYYMQGLSNYYHNLGVFERIFTVDIATRDLEQIKKSYAHFATVVRLFPDSRYAPSAHQYMIYLRNVIADHELEVAQYYYSRKAYVAAVNRANTVVRHFQGATAVPEALVLMVRSYRALHELELANDTLAVIQYNYPNSIYVREAMAPN